MSKLLLKHAVALLAFIVCSFFAGIAVAQQKSFDEAMAKKMDSLLNAGSAQSTTPDFNLSPNDAPDGVMVPSGWGGYGSALFAGLGGTFPEQFTGKRHKADMISSGGFCVGDPDKAVNFSASLNMTDVHNFSDFSGNFIVSRTLFQTSSVSVGALQLFANERQSDAAGSTYFVAISHAVQWAPSKTPGCSALSYTVGFGTGRFWLKSPDDVGAGKGKHATGVFGSVSYEIIRHVNMSAEWSGQNLGFSLGIRPFGGPLAVGLGIDNLTRYSGDRVSGVLNVGYALPLSKFAHIKG